MNKIKLQILGISSGHSPSSYTLILEENDSYRKLPVIIGAFEAQAIAIEIEKIVPGRPMTHDLFKTFSVRLGITMQEAYIHRLHEGVFYAYIVWEKDGQTFEQDARTSDAIAMALRFNAPIYTTETIMQEAGIILSETDSEEGDQTSEGQPAQAVQQHPHESAQDQNLSRYTIEELDDLLAIAIEDENYIFAAKLRDEIKNRKEND